ncbi:MAG: putative metal-binding motif-containing protein, partial [Nitrosarchaeum sp.]|nr:putative metal-binding motif-containing protein [Nitrosarchaeum sp.]
MQDDCATGVDGFFYDNTTEPYFYRNAILNSTCSNWDGDGGSICREPDAICSDRVTGQRGPIDSCANCPIFSEAQYQTGMEQIFNKLRASMPPNSYITTNGGYNTSFAPFIDAQMQEGYLHFGNRPSNSFYQKSFLVQQINWLKSSAWVNKSLFVNAGTQDSSNKILNYTFAGYLVAKRNDAYSYFQYDDRGNGIRHDYFPELFDLDMGFAQGLDYFIVGSPAQNNEVYARRYDNGLALLNINSNTNPIVVPLGASYKKLDGSIVSSVSLSDHEGMVLLNLDAPPTNCDVDNDGYDSLACGGNDCNDQNPLIHPGAIEICGNLIDEDCSGAD